MALRSCLQLARVSRLSAISCAQFPSVALPQGVRSHDLRLLSSHHPVHPDHGHHRERTRGRFSQFQKFRMTMTDEEKEKKKKEIQKMKEEPKPEGLVAKLKFYIKRYWYIAIPVHCVCSTLWLTGCYLAVKSGLDVIAVLEFLHVPELIIEKVKNTPPSAGVLVVALILYKVATPARYATTLAGIQLTFWSLRRLGMLKIAKEVEYSVRSGYEKYSGAIRQINARRQQIAQKSASKSLQKKHSNKSS